MKDITIDLTIAFLVLLLIALSIVFVLAHKKVEESNREVKQFVDNPPFTHEEYASWVRETYYSK